jgi:filamentous hemagglutinin family protein
MNSTYKLVFSAVLNAWVAVAEHVRGRGKQGTVRLLTAAAVLAGGALGTVGTMGTAWAQAGPPPAAKQLPTGAQVAAGSVSISQSQTATAASMAINQSSAKAIVNWQTFNVGANAKVNITQPSSTSVLLNRVQSSDPSQIFGQIKANGQVFLTNPNGVYFAPGSSVDVGSFTATTHGISDADFLSGNYQFSRNGAAGSIVNQGSLTAGLGGYIALLAPEVRNQGVVVAQLGGTVALAAGESYQLQLSSNGQLTNVLVTPATIQTLVDNGNAVQAPGGLIILSAQAASGLLGGVVKNSGAISATGMVSDGGTIRLSASHKIELAQTSSISADAAANSAGNGGRIDIIADLNNASSSTQVDGSISAKGGEQGGDGGFVDTSAARLAIAETTLVTTGAAMGNAGTWLLDPYDVIIAGPSGTASGTPYAASFTAGATSTILASSISNSLNAGSNVTISTGSASENTIYVNSAINATTGSATLTLTGGTINLAANITTKGSQTYNGAVVINNASGISLTSTNSSISFGSTVDSATGNNYGLTISNGSGTTVFGGAVGATTSIGGLTLNGTGTITLNGNVTTAGNQTYAGPVTAAAGVQLTANDGLGSMGIITNGNNNNSYYAFGVPGTSSLQETHWYLVASGTSSASITSASNENVGIMFYNNTGTVNGAGSGSNWCCYNYPILVNAGKASYLSSISVVSRGDNFANRMPTFVTVYGSNTPFTSSHTYTNGGGNANSISNVSILGTGYQQSNFTTLGSGSLSFSASGVALSNSVSLNNSSAYQYFQIVFTTTGGTSSGVAPNMGGAMALNAINLYGQGVGNTITFNQTVTANGALTVNAGSLAATAISAAGSLLINSRNASTITGSISNGSSAASLTKNGAGTLTLSGSNSYTGGTTVTGGTLARGSSNAFGTGTIMVDGGALDLKGSSVSNNFILGAGGPNGALTSSTAGDIDFYNNISLSANSSIGGDVASNIVFFNPVTSNGYGLVLLDRITKLFNNSNNTLTTIASGPNSGGLNIVNNQALTIGQVVLGSTTYSGINSTATVMVSTRTGDLTVSQNVSTTSTSNNGNAPAIDLRAGTLASVGTLTGGDLVLSGNPTFSIGTNALAVFYSGSSFTDAATTLINNLSTKTPFNTVYNRDSSANTFGSGYYAVFRGSAAVNIYLLPVSGQSSTYGIAPDALNYCYSSSASSCVNVSYTGIPSTPQSFALGSGTISSAVNVASGVSGTLALTGSPSIAATGLVATNNAGTYSLTLTPSLTLPGYTFRAGNAVNWTINPLASMTYTGTSGGLWSSGANWTVTGGASTGAAPTLGNVSAVVIPAGATVAYSDTMAGLTPTSAVAITNSGTINFTNTSAVSIPATITGSGVLNTSGAATTTLTAANTGFTGSATIDSGSTLKLGHANALGTSSAVMVNGTLDLNSYSPTTSSIAGTTGTITNSATGTSATLSTGGDNNSTSFGGVIQNGTGSVALTKTGSGTLTLSGANTYGGGTTISAGTLQVGAGGTSGSIGGNVTNNATLAFNRSDALSYAGVISGTGAVTKLAAGTTTLTGANTYSGGTTVSAGTLTAGSGSALGTGAVTLGASAVLDLTYSGTVALGSTLSMAAGSAITNSANTSSLSVAGASTLAGTVNTAGSQTYTGAVTLGGATTLSTLNASSANTNAAVAFGGAVDGAYALTITNGSGNVTFGSTVGAITPLASLTVTGGAGATAQTTTLGGDVTTSGNQSYGGSLILNASAISLNSNGGAIHIAGAIDAGSSTSIVSVTRILEFFTADAPSNSAYTNSCSTACYAVSVNGGVSYVVYTAPTSGIDVNGIGYSGGAFSLTGLGGSVNYTIVGGGGAGGTSSTAAHEGAGGGGGGGVATGSFTSNSATNYAISVGAGGVPYPVNGAASYSADNGQNSSLSGGALLIIAPGGGAGGGSSRGIYAIYNNASLLGASGIGQDGGSGGGANTSWSGARSGGSVISCTGATNCFGNSGGSTSQISVSGGGGGGGAGSVGGNSLGLAQGAAGGSGIVDSITGRYFAGGGGGGADINSGPGSSGGAGGSGGGGAGRASSRTSTTAAQSGLANTGGGGGGDSGYSTGDPVLLGGYGGSGIVIVSSNASTSVTTNYSSNLTINSGSGKTSIGGDISNLASLTVNSTATDSTIHGAISGATALVKSGAGGVLTLSGANTFTGATTVNGGTLAVTSATGLGSTAAGTTVASGATLEFGGVAVGAEAITLNGATLSASAGSSLSGAVTLGANSSISGAGAMTVSGAISGAGYGLALLGTGAKTLSSTSNTLSTIASGAGSGALTVVNNQALAMGQVSFGGSTYSGLNSTGAIAVSTRTGDLTVSQNISTSSTAANTAAPALKLSAGSSIAAGTASGGNLVLTGSPNLSVGSGGIAAFYSGNGSSGDGLTLVNALSSKASSVALYNKSASDLPSSSAGYYALFRESPTAVYLLPVSGQSSTYGTAPSALSYCYSSSASACSAVSITGVPGSVESFGLANSAVSAAISVPSGVSGSLSLSGPAAVASGFSASTNAGTYSLRLVPNLALTGYVFSAGNAVDFTVDRKTVTVANAARSTPYDGLSTYAGLANGASYSVSGLVGLDAVRSVTQTASGSGIVAGNVANAGSFSVTPSAAVLSTGRAGNYNFSYTGATHTVTKAQLQVEVNHDARFVGQAEGTSYFGVSYTGLVANQTPSVLGGNLQIARSNSDNRAGTYLGVLNASGLSSDNYTITYKPGNYTILPADQLLVRMANASTAYGSSPSYSASSVSYMSSTGGTVVDLTAQANVSGASFTLNDGAGGSTAFTLGARSPVLSSSGNLAAGSYQLGATSISNTSANYSNTITVVGSLSVAKKSVNASVTSGLSKVYDGTVAMVNLGYGLSGIVGIDQVAVASGKGEYAGAGAGNGLGYSVAGVSLGGSDAGNYQLNSASVTGNNGVITPAALRVAANNDSRSYDANAYSGGAGVSFSGFVAGEGSSDLGGTLAYNGDSQGAVNAGSYTITPGGLSSSNYAISYANGTLTISPANVSVSATTVALTGTVGKVYDGSNAATLEPSNYLLTGFMGSDSATITQTSGSYDTADAGAGKLVSVTLANADYAASGVTNLSNYVLPTEVSGYVGVISPRPVTVSNAARTTTYDGVTSYASLASGATASATSAASAPSGTGLVGSDALASVTQTPSGQAGSALGVAQAGSFSVTPSAAVLSAGNTANYNFIYVDSTHTVNKANATVTANSGTLTYNGANQTVNGFTATGLLGGETEAVLTGVNASRTAKNVGSYAVVASGTDGNYNLSFVDGSLVINKANATVTANSGTVTYNGANQSVSGFTASGLVGGETASVLAGVSAPGATGKNAGSYTTTASGNDGNYSLSFVDGALVINKANATVTANSGTVTYNGANQSVTGFSASGLVGGETESVLTGVSASRAAKNAGSYAVVASGTDANYNLSFVDGALVINKANATVTANSGTVTYNGANQTVSGFTASGLVGGETEAVLTGVNASRSAKNAGSYAVVASGADSNYNLSFVDGALVINKANATVTGNSGTVTYNGANQTVGGFTASGLVGGETESVLTGVNASRTAKNAGSYAVVASGADGNYNLSFVDGALVINKANATVTANSGTVTYNGANQSVTGFTASGLVGGETEAVLTGVNASRTAKNAGSYAVVASGADGNYNLSFVDGALVINKANATVTANSSAVTYSGANQSVSGFSASGLVGGETASVLAGVSAPGATGKNAGRYTTTASGLDANYNLSFVDGALVINKANASVTANSATVTYSGANQSVTGFTASGLVGGETEAALTGVSASRTAKNAGSYAVVASGTDGNYNLSFVDGALVINKANATVTANSSAVTYSGANQSVSGFSASGLVGGETASVLAGVSAPGATGKNAGSYTTTASGTDANYNLSFVDGALVINKANATVTANSGTVTYNGANQTVGGFTASGLVGGETEAVLTGVNASRTAKNAGSYAVTASGTDGNYNLSFVDGALVINKANATVTANSGTVTYNGANQSVSGFTASGLVGGETASVLAGVSAPGATGKNAGSYTTTASGNDGNYSLSFVDGALVINKANATVTANSGTVTYNGANQSVTGFTASGLVGGETEAVLTGVNASRTAKNAGSYAVVASGADGNYNLSFVDGALVINPAPLVITAATNTKSFDGNTSAQAIPTVSGLKGSDTVTNLSEAYADANPGNGKTLLVQGTYRIEDGRSGANYAVTLEADRSGVIRSLPVAVLPPAASVASTANFAQPAITVASSTSGSASGGASGNASAGSSPGVSVNTINQASQQIPGLVAVLVPSGTATVGTGLVIALPAAIVAPAQEANVPVSVTLSDRQPLPSWIRYDASTQSLITTAVPAGAFPISVLINIGSQSTVVQISESTSGR